MLADYRLDQRAAGADDEVALGPAAHPSVRAVQQGLLRHGDDVRPCLAQGVPAARQQGVYGEGAGGEQAVEVASLGHPLADHGLLGQVVPLDERDATGVVVGSRRGEQPGDACAQDDNVVRAGASWHGKSSLLSGRKEGLSR
ncbi:hypothetical protein QZH56_24370 [Streptomyces olivoreticuli]|nr:hypothetical protein [Streptomyces olivoreticuli]WKK21934.1 hypothetical protein QZH56_24370 [Streptomyces olivoreticuli]